MHDRSNAPAEAQWTRAIELDRLTRDGRAAVKVDGKHVALFMQGGAVHACNNRCPHEGYPLVEGALDSACMLTCHWHNWKFDLKSGVNQTGGDDLRIYPVKVEAGAVWIDTRDAPAQERTERALSQLDAAMAERDQPRIARELVRLAQCGTTPEQALARAIVATHERLRDGMTHAYAAAHAWLRLRDTLADDAQRLACATEAFSHIAFDTLRETAYPFAARSRRWSAAEFLAAVERQDEAQAEALLSGALEAGISFDVLEPTLASAALVHYNDFGHSAIYLEHVRGLVQRLGADVQRPLLLAWLRALVRATREDLLPDFRHYAGALAQWPANSSDDAGARNGAEFEGQNVRQALAATVALAARAAPERIHHALMDAAARHLLRFDQRHEQRTDNAVADNISWLDFTHAVTFGHALRLQCTRWPELWPQGLLQLAMFVGRNSKYLDPEVTSDAALLRWQVGDAAAFDTRCTEALLDHGTNLYIWSAHLLKTWFAVRDEIALGVPDTLALILRAAVHRLFNSRYKQRHLLRTARQALAFVEREN